MVFQHSARHCESHDGQQKRMLMMELLMPVVVLLLLLLMMMMTRRKISATGRITTTLPSMTQRKMRTRVRAMRCMDVRTLLLNTTMMTVHGSATPAAVSLHKQRCMVSLLLAPASAVDKPKPKCLLAFIFRIFRATELRARTS